MRKILLILTCALLLTGCASNIKQEDYSKNVKENYDVVIDKEKFESAFSKNIYATYINLPMYPESLIELYGNFYTIDYINHTYTWNLNDCQIIAHYNESGLCTSIYYSKEIKNLEINDFNLDTENQYTYDELKDYFGEDGYICSLETDTHNQALSIIWKVNDYYYLAYFNNTSDKCTRILKFDEVIYINN